MCFALVPVGLNRDYTLHLGVIVSNVSVENIGDEGVVVAADNDSILWRFSSIVYFICS